MNESMIIKLATDADRRRIADLAELDGKRAPTGDVLVAEVHGRLIAAVAMDGSAVADPFERTAGLVRELRAQIAGEPKRARGAGRWLGRLLPTS
jgi:hypothetical protein